MKESNYTLFNKLQIFYKTRLYPRESVIILDEIQLFPKARQAIKYLNSCIKNTSTGEYSWYSTLIDINLRHTFHVGIYEILVMDIVVCFLMNAFIRRKVRRNK